MEKRIKRKPEQEKKEEVASKTDGKLKKKYEQTGSEGKRVQVGGREERSVGKEHEKNIK